jgi:predicted nucleotidyltransferase
MLQLKSFGSVKTIFIDRDKVISALRAIAARVCKLHPEVSSIRIFGSVARGDQVGTSDVDVLIVLSGGEQGDPLEWVRVFYPYFDLPIPVDLLVYNENQVSRRLDSKDPRFEQMWRESLPLCP